MTASPHYPQANGFIERAVQTVKNLLQKCKESGADPHVAMLCLRSTPHDHNIASPAELLNSRVYQANLPSISKPGLSLSADGEVNTKLQARQDEQKSLYDKSSKPLPAIYPGDPVHVLNPHDHKWEPGIVKGNMQAPRSYMVTMTNGSTLRRTRSHIRPTGENVCIQNIPSDEPPVPSYDVCSTMPCIPRDSCEQTALASDAPASTPQADPQDLSSPLTDWTYRLNKKKKLFYVVVLITKSRSRSLVICDLHVP